MGLFVADGAIDESRVEFYATDSDERSEVEEFEDTIRAVCPDAEIGTVRNGDNCTTVRISGPLAPLFRVIGLSNGAREKSIPSHILSNFAAYEPFIEGIVLGDGYRQERERNRTTVTISTSSDRLAQELNFVLAALGYVGGNYRREGGVGVRPGDHDTTANNLVRFNPKNRENDPRLSMVPFAGPLRETYDDLERYRPWHADGGAVIETGLSQRIRLNDEEILLLDARSELECGWLSETDVAMLEIDSIEPVDPEEYVYDIATEEGNFLGNHLFCHNSATPVRGDDREEEIFTLIGPPVGTDWDALFDAGFVAEPEVEIRLLPWADDAARNEYAAAEGHERRQLAATNPAKADEVRRLLRAHPEGTLVFVDYLEQGERMAEVLGVPFVSGETSHTQRRQFFRQFREGERDALIVSRVGDEGIDLPGAEVAVVASGLGGSRRQGAQRAGRTMRPTGSARAYVLATKGTREEDFARRRTRHLAEKGVRVTETQVELE